VVSYLDRYFDIEPLFIEERDAVYEVNLLFLVDLDFDFCCLVPVQGTYPVAVVVLDQKLYHHLPLLTLR